MGARAEHSKALMERLRDLIVEGEERQFDRGPGWEPLAASTRERKARQGIDPRIMRASGLGYRTMTSKTRKRGRIARIEGHTITFGLKGGRSPVHYLRYQHIGAFNVRAGRRLPERKIVVLTSRTKRQATRVIRVHTVFGRLR